jgi:hypothetical protein
LNFGCNVYLAVEMLQEIRSFTARCNRFQDNLLGAPFAALVQQII